MKEVQCSCGCGKARLVVAGALLGRIKCHCTICQVANRAAFADSTVLMEKDVPFERIEHIRFEKQKRRMAVQRGFCRSCGCFMLARMTGIPFFPLAFVSSSRYPADLELPEPVLHVYYESHVADVMDELPKYSGKWRSQLAVLSMVLKARVSATSHN